MLFPDKLSVKSEGMTVKYLQLFEIPSTQACFKRNGIKVAEHCYGWNCTTNHFDMLYEYILLFLKLYCTLKNAEYNPVLGKYCTEHMLGCFQQFNPDFFRLECGPNKTAFLTLARYLGQQCPAYTWNFLIFFVPQIVKNIWHFCHNFVIKWPILLCLCSFARTS